MSEWISVYDSMPEKFEPVMVDGRICGGFNHGRSRRYAECYYDECRDSWFRAALNEAGEFEKVYFDDSFEVTEWKYQVLHEVA